VFHAWTNDHRVGLGDTRLRLSAGGPSAITKVVRRQIDDGFLRDGGNDLKTSTGLSRRRTSTSPSAPIA
jgi:hypothetical protein